MKDLVRNWLQITLTLSRRANPEPGLLNTILLDVPEYLPILAGRLLVANNRKPEPRWIKKEKNVEYVTEYIIQSWN